MVTLPPGSLVLALTAAVGGTALLALLHLLKVQPPRRTVATVVFWKHALGQQHRRVLWGRFSQWRSFLLLLLAVLLLAVALTGARWAPGQRGEPAVLVLDRGFSMAAEAAGRSRLDDAKEQILTDASELGTRPIAVVSAADQPELIIGFNDSSAAIGPSIARIAPATAPSNPSAALALAHDLLSGGAGRIYWYTDRRSLPEELPESVRSAIARRPVGAAAANAAILAVMIESDSANPLECAVRVRVGAWGAQRQTIGVRLTDLTSATYQTANAAIEQTNTGDVVFGPLRADGRHYEVWLEQGGAVTPDDRATFRLPRRVPFTCRLAGEVPDALRIAAASMQQSPDADRSVTITIGNADQVGPAIPAVVLITGSDTVEAGTPVEAIHGHVLTEGLSFEDAVCGTAIDLREVAPDLLPLLAAGPQEKVLAAMSGDGTRLLLSDAIFSTTSTVPHRPAFAVLLLRASRQMAGWTRPPESVPLERQLADPLWADAEHAQVIALPGSRLASNLRVEGSDNPTTLAADFARAGFPLEPWQIAGIVALALLFLEGYLHIKRRIV